MIRPYVLGLALTLAATAIAVAETPEERQACMDDAFRVCEQFIPDQDRVFRCLVQNHRAISPLCRTALAPYIPQEPAPKQAKGNNKAAPKSKGPLNLNPN